MKIDPAIFAELKLYFNGKTDISDKTLIVVSAYPLSSDEKETLFSILKKLGQNPDEVEYQVNKNILAGIVLKTGSTIIDLSLQGQLNNLKQELYEST